MTKLKTSQDKQAALNALTTWLKSQGLSIADATYLCGVLAGIGVGRLASTDRKLDHGIKVISDAIREAATMAYREENKRRGDESKGNNDVPS